MASIISQGSASGSGSVTLIPPNTNSNQTLTLPDNTGTAITTGSTNVVTPAMLAQPLTSGTAAASTSGTSIDFTGIPSWAKRITVMFNNISTNGTSNIQMQLGDASSIETTGYLGSNAYTGASSGGTRSTTGLLVSQVDATTVTMGMAIITLVSGTSWVHQCVIGRSTTDFALLSGGSKTLTGTLTRVRITTINGTDTFDAGSVNIMYE